MEDSYLTSTGNFTDTWKTLTFSSSPTVPATATHETIRLAVFGDWDGTSFPNGTLVSKYDSSGGSSNGGSATYPTWPSSVYDSSGSYRHSIYCTYTAGVSSSIKDIISCNGLLAPR